MLFRCASPEKPVLQWLISFSRSLDKLSFQKKAELLQIVAVTCTTLFSSKSSKLLALLMTLLMRSENSDADILLVEKSSKAF
jgi:hypothetical protein